MLANIQKSYTPLILYTYTFGQILKKYYDFKHGILVKALSQGTYDILIYDRQNAEMLK
jgi:hypothetical protein